MTTQNSIHREHHERALETLARSVGCTSSGCELLILLRRIEVRLHRACVSYSNLASYGLPRWERDKEGARRELARVFGGKIPAGVYLNGDPRGHMLKLDAEKVTIPAGMQTDWGSDGILAPEDFK